MKRNQILAIGLLILLTGGCRETRMDMEKHELPVINIEFEGIIPKDEKIPMVLFQTDQGNSQAHKGRIERRGGFSINFSKHSFEVDLDEDISLAGLPKDDDWILNANYIDKTFLRHVVSYELFSEMNDKNLAPKTKYVELELNGVYNGLYVLMEKLDKSSLKIKGKDTDAVIFKEPHIFRETYEGITPKKQNNFHQQTYPKIDVEDKTAFVESIREFILTSTDSVFEHDIFAVFDIENIIDWHLLLLISNNSDGILKNFYLYKIDSKTPLRIAPWDYDHSFGRDGDNELNLDARPLNIERSILFARLLTFDWYKKMVKERWEYLNIANILSKSGLRQKFISKSKIVRGFAKMNFELWPVTDSWYYDSNDFEQEIDIILQFLELRHRRISDYFDKL